jgi:hypothetical protein
MSVPTKINILPGRVCTVCKIEKDKSEFGIVRKYWGKTTTLHIYLDSRCRSCANKAGRTKKHREIKKLYARKMNIKNSKKFVERYRRYCKDYPQKVLAHQAVARAMRKGILTIAPCVVCGSDEKVIAHHNDYKKPLEVVFLCRPHHYQVHKNQNSIERQSR